MAKHFRTATFCVLFTQLYAMLRASCLKLEIKEFICSEVKIEESEKGHQPPRCEPRTPCLNRQCSATELWQPDNHQPSQSSTCTAVRTSLGVDWKILSIRKEAMLCGYHSGWLRHGIQFLSILQCGVTWLTEVGVTEKCERGIMACYITCYIWLYCSEIPMNNSQSAICM